TFEQLFDLGLLAGLHEFSELKPDRLDGGCRFGLRFGFWFRFGLRLRLRFGFRLRLRRRFSRLNVASDICFSCSDDGGKLADAAGELVGGGSLDRKRHINSHYSLPPT